MESKIEVGWRWINNKKQRFEVRFFQWFSFREWYRTEFAHAPGSQEVGAECALETRTKAPLSTCV